MSVQYIRREPSYFGAWVMIILATAPLLWAFGPDLYHYLVGLIFNLFPP